MTKFWNDADPPGFRRAPDLSRNAPRLSLSVKTGGIPTDIAPADRADIPSHWGKGDESVRAPWHFSRCYFVLVHPGCAHRGIVFLEIR